MKGKGMKTVANILCTIGAIVIFPFFLAVVLWYAMVSKAFKED